MSEYASNAEMQVGEVLGYQTADEGSWVASGIVYRGATVPEDILLITHTGLESFDEWVSDFPGEVEIAVGDSTPATENLARRVEGVGPFSQGDIDDALSAERMWKRTCRVHPGQERPCSRCRAGT